MEGMTLIFLEVSIRLIVERRIALVESDPLEKVDDGKVV